MIRIENGWHWYEAKRQHVVPAVQGRAASIARPMTMRSRISTVGCPSFIFTGGGESRAVAMRPSHIGDPPALAGRSNFASGNLSIVPKGIEDFGDGRKYTPIDLVMKARGCDADTALGWLAERLGYNSKPKVVLVNGPKTLERIRARDAARKAIAR